MLHILAVLVTAWFLSSCGPARGLFTDRRGAENPEPVPGPNPVTARGDDTYVEDQEVAFTSFDEIVTQAVPSNYLQSDRELSDLFSKAETTRGTSMLCWPAALAYQLRYQKTAHQPPLKALRGITEPNGTTVQATRRAANTDVRFFAKACNTDLDAGTTLPRGVGCIVEQYRLAGYKASVRISGNDAKWVDFGLYPEGTATDDRAFTPQDLKDALAKGESVIALVGFYQRKDSTTWTRASGHFVSLTGYWTKRAWTNDKILVQTVNPAVDYAPRGDDRKFDRVRFEKVTGDGPNALVRFSVRGPGFEVAGYEAFLESIVRFAGSKQRQDVN